ncbi:MAG: hypothetical protein IJ002_01450 [Clostridia bacterium]|nr:hypothetical protein [Clostridia bacterium]
MIFIGKKPEKPNVAKITLTVIGIVAGVAALAFAAYKLYKKLVPACIDCECEDFLDDDDIFFDEDEDVEVRLEDANEDADTAEA